MPDHASVFAGFVEDVRALVGQPLVSVIAYGSAVSRNFRPGISDYNFLIVVERVDLPVLERLAGVAAKWRKRRISAPLVVESDFVSHALDSWPLEFLSMSARYSVLHGVDPFAGMVLQREHVRLQCEREIRSKLLLFRRGFLESEGAPKRLKIVLDRGWPSLLAILQGMLYLKGGPWQAEGEELWNAVQEQFGIPTALLAELHALRCSKSVPARDTAVALYGRLLEILHRIAEQVDGW